MNEGPGMRRAMFSVVFVMAGFLATGAEAQFKSQVPEQPSVDGGLIHTSSPSLLFGWFNPERFHMSHSLSFTYQTIGSQGMSLGTYTNSMRYDIAQNLSALADVSLSYSPYNSFSTFGKNDLSSVYLSRAELNYKPWENTLVRISYRNNPFGYYSPYYYNPWFGDFGY